MASALAHELNQPLTATTTAVRAARRMLATAQIIDAPAALGEAMDLAVEQALRAGHIVRRLREFVARGGEADKRFESLPRLIEEASALALVGTKETGVRVSFSLAANIPFVLVDRVQIQQVLVNVMRNAVQAMVPQDLEVDSQPDSRRELTVTACVKDQDTVEVAVSDTGPGLAAEVAERLFEPFVTTKPGGMGVGLSICRSIIEAHGGRLWVEPNPSGGTVFRFTLEAVQPDQTQAEADAT
jgi:two-component system sensor kinase FixL